jgi:hypothetical protein
MVSDGFFASGGGAVGDVAGVINVGANLAILSSSQAVLSSFDHAVVGPVFIGVNRDSGLETLILSR